MWCILTYTPEHWALLASQCAALARYNNLKALLPPCAEGEGLATTSLPSLHAISQTAGKEICRWKQPFAFQTWGAFHKYCMNHHIYLYKLVDQGVCDPVWEGCDCSSDGLTVIQGLSRKSRLKKTGCIEQLKLLGKHTGIHSECNGLLIMMTRKEKKGEIPTWKLGCADPDVRTFTYS